jgi:hypothetical protein
MGREAHSEEMITGVIDELGKQSDRGAGIIAAAFTEEILEKIILNRLRPLSSDKYRDLFKGNSPLSTFAAKIDMAFAIGVLNEIAHRQLHLIRKVRNCFAHSIQPLDFEHSEIKQLIGSNELIANSGLLQENSTRNAFLWSFRVTVIGLMFWRDSRVALRLVHDDCPELAAAIRQYFDEHFTQVAARSLAQTPAADQAEDHQNPPAPADESGRP